MIRYLVIAAFCIGLALSPALVAVAANSGTPVYVQKDKGGSKWSLKNWFSAQPKPQAPGVSVSIPGGKSISVTPEMLTTSYEPKSTEELVAIARAHRAWEADGVKQIEAMQEMRMAKLERDTKAAYQKYEKKMQAENARTPSGQASSGAAETPEKKVIFNRPGKTKEPAKVFTGYR